jgi:hypothetical protein
VRDSLGEFEPQALMMTNDAHTPLQMLSWFVRGWRMEVTFEEARAHLGMETQRQWNRLAIARSTPLLLGLFWLVTLLANDLFKAQKQAVRTAGRARYVSFYWTPCGDEIMYSDGRLSADGQWHAWLVFTRHRTVSPHL